MDVIKEYCIRRIGGYWVITFDSMSPEIRKQLSEWLKDDFDENYQIILLRNEKDLSWFILKYT